jgi:hypothetical protein
MNIAGRLDKLEEVMRPKRVIVVWQNYDEPESAAIARWSAAHPNEPPPNETDTTIYLIKWGDPE